MGRRLSKKDDELIYNLYVNEKKSSVEIGNMLNTSHRSVLNHLDKMGIKRRDLSEAHFARNRKNVPSDFYNFNKMYNLYVIRHFTKEQLGKMYNCAPHVIDRVLKELNIHVRDVHEAKIGVQSGEQHHNWKGGITSLNHRCREYFQNNISPKARERDNYTCQLCGSHSNLHVHHIVPFSSIIKDICDENANLDPLKDINELYNIIIKDKRFLDEGNLITYCKDCHLFIIHGYKKDNQKRSS